MNFPFSRFTRRTRAAAIGLAGIALAATVHAGGPIGLCDTDSPLLWPAGGVGIPFNPDLGDLGPIAHDDAVALVQSAFDVWADVPSATVTYANTGELPVDVDIDNFLDYLIPVAPDGYSAIVFDDTGEIFELLYGPDSGILGFAGPEWVDFTTCEILEGVSFLNGPAFTDFTYALDVMVHEFGHYSGLGHTVVNGQVYIGDTTGPGTNDPFGSPPDPSVEDVVETMYPFYFGTGIGTASPEKDDIAAISTLYPEADFVTTTATITGVIRSPISGAPLSGINVIARNLADPFVDAVSAISGNLSAFNGDPETGRYTLRGLTPGAEYAIFIDQIIAGGFSTPLINVPGPEEYYNGADESNGLTSPDVTSEYTPVSAAAGATAADIDIIVNTFAPGTPLPVGDDGSVELFLPFTFKILGQWYSTVIVNANGNVTFGARDGTFVETVVGFLDGPPRIAALWQDLNPTAGGTVTYSKTANTFTIRWKDVPEYPNVGANTFSIALKKGGNVVEIKYGKMSATEGLTGLSGGYAQTSGAERPINLSGSIKSRIGLWSQPAIYEVFSASRRFDLGGKSLLLQHDIDYNDRWAKHNNAFGSATPISLPFRSDTVPKYTEIEPVGGDVDFLKFEVTAGEVIRAETIRGAFDTVLGIFDESGNLVAVDDDSGLGTLSKVSYVAPVDGTYQVAVSAFADFGFTGGGGSGGRYVLKVETVSCGIPSPENWIVNSGFETGDFLCWNVLETGTAYLPLTVTDGSAATYFTPPVPPVGSFEAVGGFDGDGPMQIVLYQDVTIPAGEPFLTLEWKERLQWELFEGPNFARTYAVLILDPVTNGLLRLVKLVDTGLDPAYTDSGWVDESYDVSEFIGQTIRLMYFQDIPESFTGPGQFELDEVRMRSQ